MFLQHLDPSSSSITAVGITAEEIEDEKELKIGLVKEEKLGDSDEDFDDEPHFGDDDDDNEDDLDDQPLTKLASKLPKKESVDLLDLIDNAKVAEKRKSTVKVKATPIKKVKLKKETKASASKEKPEKKKKDETEDAVRKNAETLIHYATAYPFRVNWKSISCVFCRKLYTDPAVFRMHMDDDHRTSSLELAYYHKTEYIKADVSDLRCRLCDEKLPDLNATADHLNTVHGKTIDMSAKLGVMPFVLQKGCYVCALCQSKLPSLTVLWQHTITHFIDFACEVCGNGFMTEAAMIKHELATHLSYEVSCSETNEVFPNTVAMERHRRMHEKCLPYTCSKCPQRFNDWNTRGNHLKRCHCKDDPYRCVACSVVFTEEKEYYMHLKLEHLQNSAVCTNCGLKFTSKYALKRHRADNCK